ncbi:hypothetical protein SESBI_03945 [Sesbania bispinosa]|nr:hypothetical protein SESBI_03945 [Sesbania bispinosa]
MQEATEEAIGDGAVVAGDGEKRLRNGIGGRQVAFDLVCMEWRSVGTQKTFCSA